MKTAVPGPHAGVAGLPQPRGRTRAKLRLDAQGFTLVTMFACLVLQRFAFPAGGALKISFATPIVLGMSVWGLLNGTLALDRRRTALYFGLCGTALIAVITQVSLPVALAPRSSLNSLLYWLLITGFAALRFREPVEETSFFSWVNTWLLGAAAAGILQFLAQFVGIKLFSFSGIIPDSLLMEEYYAVVLNLQGSDLLRSNGFFFVEPSVFSQFMAVGTIIEGLYFRRPPALALLFAGLLVSSSGTGWMVLGAFVIVLAFCSGPRGLLGAILLVGGAALAIAAASFAVPEVVQPLFDRVDEFSVQGTSGNERFVTPFMALSAALAAAPWSFFTGLGPGTSEDLALPFMYRLNTPVKIQMEYGIFGLFFYLCLLIVGTRPRRQWLLLAPLLTLLLLTGGYQQLSPVLFAVLLLGTVSTLKS